MALEHVIWSIDEDWDAVVVGQTKHAHHHVLQDCEGVWICRECSTDRLYTIPQPELDRMLIVERQRQAKAEGR